MPRKATDPIHTGDQGVVVYPPNPERHGKPATLHRIVWRRPDGTRKNLWRADRTEALAVAADLDRQLAAHAAGHPDARPDDTARTRTVTDLAEHWLNPSTHEDPWSISHTTSCESIVRNWILPALGNTRLSDVTDIALRDLLTDVRQRRPKSVRRVGVALSGMFRLAVDTRWLAANPMAAVRYSPRKKQQGVSAVYVPLDRRPTTGAAHTLADTADRLWPRERPGDMVLLAAYTGIRKGEMFALTDRDIEFLDGGGRANIDRSVQHGTRGRHVHLPKYQKIRETFIPDFVADRIADRLTWPLPQARTYGCDDHNCPDQVDTGGRLLFPSPQSDWWHSNNYDRRRFRPACTEAGWPALPCDHTPRHAGDEPPCTWKWTWHGLRHHFCTWALAPTHSGGRGLEVADVSYFAGHSTPEFTYRAYVSPREGAVGRALGQ